jgi:intein/homing endonuclease
MKRKRVLVDKEKDLLVGMIISDRFLKDIRTILNVKLLRNPYSRRVAQWCLDYYTKYEEAPKGEIQSVFDGERESLSEEESEYIEKFLIMMSKKVEKMESYNDKFHLDNAELYLKEQKLNMFLASVKSDLDSGDIAKAEHRIVEFERLERPRGEGVNILEDEDKIINAINDENETLLNLDGDLGELLGDFYRGDLVAIAGPPKRGKCLVGSTKVLLSDGRVKTVKEIIDNKISNVVSMNNDYKFVGSFVSDFWKNGEKECFEIKTRTGRKISVTKNHPMYKFIDGWQTIGGGLSVGDYIAVPKKLPFFGNGVIPREHVRLLAYLLADGGLTKGIVYTKKDPVLLEDFCTVVKMLGDVAKLNGINVAVTKGYCGPKKSKVRELLESYGVGREKSVNKQIPDVVFSLKKELLSEFLMILFSGDGGIHNGVIEYSTGSEDMARQVVHLLLRFGVVSKLTKKKVNEQDYWKIAIRDAKYVLQFIDEIGFFGEKYERSREVYLQLTQKYKRSYLDILPSKTHHYLDVVTKGKNGKFSEAYQKCIKWDNNICIQRVSDINSEVGDVQLSTFLDDDVLWDKIVSIENVGVQETFDLTVPEYSNFIAGDMVVHNSWWLQFFAIAALINRLSVLFVSLEMTEAQNIRRFVQSFTGGSLKDKEVYIPKFKDIGEESRVVYEVAKLNRITIDDWDEAVKNFKRLNQGSKFRLLTYPQDTLSNNDLEIVLDNLEYYDDFVPDVLIVDYEDIMASEPDSPRDYRQRLDHSWKKARSIAQKRNLLYITATQTDRSTLRRDAYADNVAEDMRKLAHVAKMIGLNQSKDEKKKSLMRLGLWLERHDGSFETDDVVVTQCLSIGKPCMDSRWKKNVKGVYEDDNSKKKRVK